MREDADVVVRLQDGRAYVEKNRHGPLSNGSMITPRFKFELGALVRCKVTGYEGIITGRTEWLHGCVGLAVKSHGLKGGKPIESVYFDEDAVVLVKTAADVAIEAVKSTG